MGNQIEASDPAVWAVLAAAGRAYDDLMRMRNLELDHIVPRSRGGRHTDSNLQLLCGWCNRTKGNRDMDYLRVRLREMGD